MGVTAKKDGIDINWIEAFPSCPDCYGDVCFASHPSAPGKGNASARSSLGSGGGEGFQGLIAPEKRDRRRRLLPLLEVEARGREGRDEEFSARANDILGRVIADLSDEDVLTDIAYPRSSTYPAFGGLIAPEKRDGRRRLLTLLEAEALRRGIDTNSAEPQDGGASHRDPRSDTKCSFSFDFDSEAERTQRYHLKSSPIQSTKKNYGEVNDDVVLLDDEDVQPDEPVDCGVPEEWNESKIYYPSR